MYSEVVWRTQYLPLALQIVHNRRSRYNYHFASPSPFLFSLCIPLLLCLCPSLPLALSAPYIYTPFLPCPSLPFSIIFPSLFLLFPHNLFLSLSFSSQNTTSLPPSFFIFSQTNDIFTHKTRVDFCSDRTFLYCGCVFICTGEKCYQKVCGPELRHFTDEVSTLLSSPDELFTLTALLS